jgi:hypothetical protein
MKWNTILWNTDFLIFSPALSDTSVFSFRHLDSYIVIFHYDFNLHFFFFFCSTRVWTQGLHLEPLHQPFLFCDSFFQDRVLQTLCRGWLQIVILLISAFWVARITGVSHWCPECIFLMTDYIIILCTFWAFINPFLFMWIFSVKNICSFSFRILLHYYLLKEI